MGKEPVERIVTIREHACHASKEVDTVRVLPKDVGPIDFAVSVQSVTIQQDFVRMYDKRGS